MVATFSPHRDAGGTLHMHSPTGIHHVDASSAIRQLRRSISRSPSKTNDFRFVTSRSHSPSNTTPFSPSPLSPSSRSASASGNIYLIPTVTSPSPLAIPFPPSAKVNRPAMRRNGQAQATPRIRTSPKSPAKRVLSDSSHNGNATPIVSPGRRSREEKAISRGGSPERHFDQENERKVAAVDSSDNSLAPRYALSRLEKRHSGTFGGIISTSSPLKRSDGIMNLDQASLGSPSAKRRSLHGANFSPDFNVFDHDAITSNPSESACQDQVQDEDEMHDSQETLNVNPSHFTSIPKRSSSLRKSTLQQRQNERPTFARARPNADLALESATPGQGISKNRQRMSLDNHMPPMTRESPFSSQGTLPSASVHILASQQNTGSQGQHYAHPLSRTMTQSSSNSSMADESPTHEPVHKAERPRTMLDFSKSLPVGAPRPLQADRISRESSNLSSGSFATPEHYKLAKPLPAAFMSTGLISKKNRNVDDLQAGQEGNKIMPDTPCKRPINIFPTVHKPVPESAIEKARQVRHSFGTPSTPFNAHISRPTTGGLGRGINIFGSNFNKNITRRASFASIEDDRSQSKSQSPNVKADSQSTTDSEFPPTPTKHAMPQGNEELLRSQRRLSTRPANATPTTALEAFSTSKAANSKLSPSGISPTSVDGDSDSVMEDSPSATLRLKSSQTTMSFTRSRLLRNLNSPTPLSRKSLTVPIRIRSPLGIAKSRCLSPASPFHDRFERMSPHTPQENILPPDPSGLSISAHSDRPLYHNGSSSVSVLPATPTAPKEYFPQFGKWTILPLGGFDAPDVDQSLTSRFEKVEIVGTGEFSQVYRVTQPQETSPFHSIHSMFTLSTTRSSSSSSLPERVWAVKKSRHPYAGARDRQRKVHEVDVLKALGHADHIITFVDSWEEKGHLYIQTEFCDEGSLEMFLAQVGLKARVDDFRIWKILLELAQGLKHIHDSGFIHLDLKPANVLITFEGVLKIADFGMATRWPAKAGIEGEGDREYIGPEILMGRYDKPADIFALGLIMLETAGNVELPDNGVSWQKLRNGDMSDVPSLTWSSETSNIVRDASGNPLPQEITFEEVYGSDEDDLTYTNVVTSHRSQLQPSGKSGLLARSGELIEPPIFMVDATNDQALDRIVRWMISPEPVGRPVPDQILRTVGVRWAEARRRAGATVFEGNWGPADEVLAEDAEMIDV